MSQLDRFPAFGLTNHSPWGLHPALPLELTFDIRRRDLAQVRIYSSANGRLIQDWVVMECRVRRLPREQTKLLNKVLLTIDIHVVLTGKENHAALRY